MQALEIADERLVDIYGDDLRGTRYQHCLTSTERQGLELSLYVNDLRSLTDDRLLDRVVHDPRPSHRMAYLDAIERRWHSYEALATNRPPLQFSDDVSIEASAWSLVADSEDRDTYVSFRRAYRDQRWKWLEEHPTRRRQQVVISGRRDLSPICGLFATREEQVSSSLGYPGRSLRIKQPSRCWFSTRAARVCRRWKWCPLVY